MKSKKRSNQKKQKLQLLSDGRKESVGRPTKIDKTQKKCSRMLKQMNGRPKAVGRSCRTHVISIGRPIVFVKNSKPTDQGRTQIYRTLKIHRTSDKCWEKLSDGWFGRRKGCRTSNSTNGSFWQHLIFDRWRSFWGKISTSINTSKLQKIKDFCLHKIQAFKCYIWVEIFFDCCISVGRVGFVRLLKWKLLHWRKKTLVNASLVLGVVKP